MEFWIRAVVGLALMVGSVAALGWSVLQLFETGTCASGGPYVSARPCPPGTGWLVGAMSASVPVFLLGGWLFANRGRSATDPGLPDQDPLANPRPFGN